MHVITIQEVQAHLPRLVEQAEAGDTIVILEAGKPRAVIAPYLGGTSLSSDASGPRPTGQPVVLPHWPGEVIGILCRDQIYAGDD